VVQSHWVRSFALIVGILFLLSWVFPIGAGVAKDTSVFPKWWGPLDVAVAFVLAITAFGIQIAVRGAVDERAEQASYCIYRTLIHGIMAVGILVIVGGDRIKWVNCATGFLWRSWLGLYILPSWLVALRSDRVGHS
jgi:hypothetical protein